MKKLLIGLAVVLVLVIVALLAAPSFIPVTTYKDQIAKAARDATGRELSINGEFTLSLLPRFELEAKDVAFANAPGASQAEMAKLKELLVRLQMLPLLRGQVRVDSLVLVEPVIHLEVDKNGRANWLFAQPAAAGPEAEAKAEKAPDQAPKPAAGAGRLGELSLGDVRLDRGLVTYHDAASGQTMELSDITMAVSLPNLGSPFAAEGSLIWNDETVTLTIDGDSPRRLMDGEDTPLKVALQSAPVKLTYDGQVTLAEVLRVVGELDLDVPSIRQLAAWSGSPIELEGSGLGPLKIRGAIGVNDRKFAFTNAQIVLDKMNATGSFTADAGGARPSLVGRLDIDLLDLNPYLPAPSEEPRKGTQPAQSAAAKSAGPPPDWSDDPIDLGGLKAADLNFDLSVGGIRLQEIKVGRSALSVTLKDGLLVSDLKELNLYDGKGAGKLTADGRGRVPAVATSFKIAGVSAEPLLTDAAAFDSLEGTGRFDIAIEAKGASERAMVQALNGKGAFQFKDGAIKGVNLAAAFRNVKTLFTGKGSEGELKTDFAELSGSFKIENGILHNDDLKLLNPLLRVAGAGRVDLPRRSLKYRVQPKVVGSLEGQGAQDEAAGLMVPIIVEGPWHDLSYGPDVAGLADEAARAPAKALEKTLKDAGGGLGEALKGLTKPPGD